MSSSYTFNWPSGPEEVIVTGSFDDWTKSLPLVKQTDGSFELTVPFEKDIEVLYKYVVDGEWLTNPAQSLSTDSDGNENNILTSDHLFTSEAQSKIPEAGGLAVVPGSLQTTVMPSTEGQQTTLGEAGIFVPKDKDSLAAFSVYENTDRNLNEKPIEEVALTPEEKQKQKKKLKRTRYRLNKKARANGEASSTSRESSPEAEDHSHDAAAAASAAALLAANREPKEDHTAENAAKEAYGSSNDVKEPHHAVTAADAEKKAGVPTKDELAATAVTAKSVEPVAPKEETSEVSEVSEPPAHKQEPAPAAPYSLTEKDIPGSTVVAEAPSKTEEAVVGEEDKEPAPYALTEKDIPGSKVAPVPVPVAVPSAGVSEPEKESAPYALTGDELAQSTVKPVEGKSVEAEKAPAPYALTEDELAQSTVKPAEGKPVEEEQPRSTLDPTVIGVVGAAAAGSAVAGSEAATHESPDAVARKISSEKTVEPSVHPAIDEPIVPALSSTGPAFPAQLAPASNIEDVSIAPVSHQAKEVTALPVNIDNLGSEEEIIIAQGGHDVKEIEQQIVAAEDGPVSVEEIQPTVSEAKDLAEEAHIPRDEIKAAVIPAKGKNAPSSSGKTSASGKSSKTEGKEKKKGFFSKIKKIFK